MKWGFRIATAALVAHLSTAPVHAETRLLMFDDEGCYWCESWKEEIGPIYPKTTEGKLAPLQVVSIHDKLPEGTHLKRQVVYTPTFVLMDEGEEISRIEGYPGEDFFWGLLEQMLNNHSDAKSKS